MMPGMPSSLGPSPLTGTTAPATTPPQNTGMMLAGKAAMAIAMKALEAAVPKLGAATVEGKAVIECLGKLGKLFGPVDPSMTRSEVKLLAERAAPISEPSPGMADSIRSGLESRGVGGPGPEQPSNALPMLAA